jgi:thiosulfate/3-mercaptopyruvate sulfurtransferase
MEQGVTDMTQLKSPMVSVEWLAQRLGTQNLIILDATFFMPAQGRHAAKDYAVAHIPGAQFFDIDAIADPASDLPHMLPNATDFALFAAGMGIGAATTVVIYDANHFMASARAWWTFRVFGHDRVFVLDGGLARWNDRGLPLSSAVVTHDRAIFDSCFRPNLVYSLNHMLELLVATDKTQIVDARSAGRYAGSEPEPRTGLRSGHIPGSHNLPFSQLIDANSHRLKPQALLLRAFLDAGIDPQRLVVATCGSGVTASILALALYCLGNHDVAVYDGSWSEWGLREDTPISRL